jgi:DNA primase large subunit
MMKILSTTKSQTWKPSFYESIPRECVHIHDLFPLTKARFTILKDLEKWKSNKRAMDETIHWDKSTLEQFQMTQPNVDAKSHWLLKLALCHSSFSKQQRDWMVYYETVLLQSRLEKDRLRQDMLFTFSEEIVAEKVTPSTLEQLPSPFKEKFSDLVRMAERQRPVENTCFWRIPFEWAGSLLATKRVWVHQGWVYLSERVFESFVYQLFKQKLEQQVKTLQTSVHVQWFLQDERCTAWLDQLHQLFHIREKESIDQNLEKVLVQVHPEHFPLCMKRLHQQVIQKIPLKHDGRLQLLFFLKGAGFTLSQNLSYWKQSISDEKKWKEVEYNIQHAYGKKASGTSYRPYSCSKMIASTPRQVAHQVHGCPFVDGGWKTMVKESLVDIENLVDQQQYQHACGWLLQKSKVSTSSCLKEHVLITSPNHYLIEYET